jgi:hypothetical protein
MTPKNATTNARSTHCITGRLIQTCELRTGFASVTEVWWAAADSDHLSRRHFGAPATRAVPAKLSNAANVTQCSNVLAGLGLIKTRFKIGANLAGKRFAVLRTTPPAGYVEFYDYR